MDRILPDSGELAKTMMGSSLADLMQELGYGFCARYLLPPFFFHHFQQVHVSVCSTWRYNVVCLCVCSVLKIAGTWSCNVHHVRWPPARWPECWAWWLALTQALLTELHYRYIFIYLYIFLWTRSLSEVHNTTNHILVALLIGVFSLQTVSAPGSGIWSDGKDKSDSSQPHTWNVDVLIDVVKEFVSPIY